MGKEDPRFSASCRYQIPRSTHSYSLFSYNQCINLAVFDCPSIRRVNGFLTQINTDLIHSLWHGFNRLLLAALAFPHSGVDPYILMWNFSIISGYTNILGIMGHLISSDVPIIYAISIGCCQLSCDVAPIVSNVIRFKHERTLRVPNCDVLVSIVVTYTTLLWWMPDIAYM